MDLRSILNIDDRPKLATRSKRPDARAAHHKSSAAGQHLTSDTIRVEGFAGTPIAPITSPVYDTFPTRYNSESTRPAEGQICYPSNQGRSGTGNRPRISLSTSSTSSTSPTTVKRRASANSPVSYSSSTSSSPSPCTPSSMTSSGVGFGSVPSCISRIHGKGSAPGPHGLEIQNSLSRLHQIVPQDPYTMTGLSSMMQTDQVVHTTPVHLNRRLPLPKPVVMTNQMEYRQCIPKHQAMAPQQPKSPKFAQIRNTSAQRLCSASTNCENTTPKRRIVSQFFGRNKKETRLIPRHCWVFYCRQHYQRSRYRLDATRFAELQMSLVRTTVAALEKEGAVLSWEIRLRKRAQERLAKAERDMKSNRKSSGYVKMPSIAGPGTREKTLLPYCGSGKSFGHVYEVLDAVNAICRRDGGPALEFELLPNFSSEYQLREETRRRACREEGYGSDSDSDDDD